MILILSVATTMSDPADGSKFENLISHVIEGDHIIFYEAPPRLVEPTWWR